MSLTETCIHVLTCICWIKVLCPTGKERMIILNMYIYTFIVISAYNRMILLKTAIVLDKVMSYIMDEIFMEPQGYFLISDVLIM